MLSSEINWKRQERLNDRINLFLDFLVIDLNSPAAKLVPFLFWCASHLRPLFANDGVVFFVADFGDLGDIQYLAVLAIPANPHLASEARYESSATLPRGVPSSLFHSRTLRVGKRCDTASDLGETVPRLYEFARLVLRLFRILNVCHFPELAELHHDLPS